MLDYATCLAKLRESVSLFEMEPAAELLARISSADLPDNREQDAAIIQGIQEALDAFDYEQAEKLLATIEEIKI